MLDEVSDWTEVNDEFLKRWAPIGHRELELLLERGVLQEPSELRESQWNHWGPIATNSHAVSRDARYPATPEARQTLAEEIAADSTNEEIFKQYPQAPTVPLPRVFSFLSRPYGEVLTARRTHRVFTPEAVRLDDLATVLHYTFGPQRFIDAGLFGTLQLKCSPSAGSRHEEECYVYVRRVQGLDAALYHYNALQHSLEVIVPRIDESVISTMTCGQAPCSTAAFIVFSTTVVARIVNKYRHPRAYRLWMYNAGHYGQTFAMTCEALGLGAFQTAAFLDSAVEETLGLDSASEFAAYVLAAGIPAVQSHGEPMTYHYPKAGPST